MWSHVFLEHSVYIYSFLSMSVTDTTISVTVTPINGIPSSEHKVSLSGSDRGYQMRDKKEEGVGFWASSKPFERSKR